MQTVHDELGQIIDNLLLIKNNTDKISSIEKDILLQNLREAYLAILRYPVSDEVQVVEKQEEKEEEPQKDTVVEDVVGEKEEKEVEEPSEEENEEMDTDILEFVKAVPKAVFEEKSPIQQTPDLFSEPTSVPEPLKVVEPEPVVEAKAEPVVAPEPKAEKSEDSELAEEPLKVETPEPKPTPEPVVVVEPEPVVEAKPEPVVVPEPEPIVEPEVEKPEDSELAEHALEPEPIPEPVKVEEKPQQRSLNDLFNEQKQDLGEKFQQTKITDLTKAMSINDKFLFIRELFKNKSEEFSHAIHTLNKCENIEEAFDTMEGLKKQYFWDSTSSAYLALCDLVRRKF